METIDLTIVTNVSFANALRRLIMENQRGAMYVQDAFVYNENMKSFDVGFSYTAPEYYKTDFNPYRMPKDPPSLTWQLRPQPVDSGIEVSIITGDSLKSSDKKWHFDFNRSSEIGTLQPSEYYTDLHYTLTTKSAKEDARFTQVNCSYGYDERNISDDSPINIRFHVISKNGAINLRKYMKDLLSDLLIYLESIRDMFSSGNSRKINAISVDDSIEIRIDGFGNTLVEILMSQTPQFINRDETSFKAYIEHPTNEIIIIKLDHIGKKKNPIKSWEELLTNMVDAFIYQMKHSFIRKLNSKKKK